MKRIVSALIGIILAHAWNACALSIGDTALPFTLTTTNDSSCSLTHYQGRVRVLFFFCPTCSNERAAVSAVEKYIWQVYKAQGVAVLGIETSSDPNGTAKRLGITFPVAINGQQTASAYGGGSNSVFLVDKHEIVRAIAKVPPALEPLDAQVDSTVQAIAGKIPALLATAVKRPRMAAHEAGNGSAVGDNVRWTVDVKGRSLKRAASVKAALVALRGAGSAEMFMRRK
jgi:peroxiredoxin